MDNLALKVILEQFKVSFHNVNISPINQGYINDTFLISIDGKAKYILQRINTNVFKNPEILHQNFNKALSSLKGLDYQEILLIRTNDNSLFFEENENCWRLLTYIKNSIAYNFTNDSEIALEAGKVLGKFHTLLAGENPNDFKDIIKNLNYLPSKIIEFETALENTTKSKIDNAKHLIDFVTRNKSLFDSFYEADLPIRICHNDTKLNNMLFDKTSKKGLCFIDLDTIMQGYFHYDFGDTIRTVVSESNEDEKTLTNIKFNRFLFEKFIQGLSSYSATLINEEVKFLPISCALMPFMHGIRALTDYLNGNIYYKITYENQNLDRCKSLFEFTKHAIKDQKFITSVINKYLIKD